MKRFQLDPKNPRQLTPAEARRLDAMPVDALLQTTLVQDDFCRLASWTVEIT